MNRKGLSWIFLMLVLALFWGCSDDDTTQPPTTTAFETMATAGAAYINSPDCPGVISAQTLKDNLADYTVIDIRSNATYLAGHIPGAYNSSLATLLTDVGTTIPTDKPLVVACYTGQSAGRGKIALEMMGYADVYTLGFGMSSWSTALCGGWDGAVGDNLASPETTNNNASLVEHEFPVLTEAPATVVQERVQAMLLNGSWGKAWSDIQDNLDAYFIVNYFGADDYNGVGTAGVPGHIPGAFQFTPGASLGADQMLKYLPTDMPIIVYCWTSQTSSQVTAYLQMLGYDAYSLRYGANTLFHSSLTAHTWAETSKHDYSLASGYQPNETFQTLLDAGINYVNTADCPGVISAQVLYDNLSDYTVIDIRSQATYDAGHIAGAYHSSLGTLLSDVGTTIPTDKPLVVACYSGQSAGHAKIALEMMGYTDTYTLGFGMSSWSTQDGYDHWTSSCANLLTNPETTHNNTMLVWHDYPTLADETPQTVVADRVAAMLTDGFKSIGYSDIQDNLGDYFILNYFGEADYDGTGSAGTPGHIPGAYQFSPGSSLGLDQLLGHLPLDKPIVVYCWTGQTSSQITAFLNMLGYEAYSLRNGSNALFHDSLTAHAWGPGSQHDFPLEVTPLPNM